MGEMAGLIEEGTRDDGHAFDVALMSDAKEILLKIGENTRGTSSTTDDPIMIALNTSKGKLLSALLNASLRIARAKPEGGWDTQLKSFFEKEMTESPSVELHTILGMHTMNFMYLDKKWVLDNATSIFNKKNEMFWFGAMTGYLQTRPSKELYQILKTNGDYEKALGYESKGREFVEHFLLHICLAYFNDWESLDSKEDLISKIANRADLVQEIVGVCLRFKDLKNEHKLKIRRLWGRLFESNKENKNNLGVLVRWLRLFDEIDDDMFSWSIEGVKYMEENDAYWLIEAMEKLVETEPSKVGALFLIMLENSKGILAYQEDKIYEIVEKLYGKGEKDAANKICNSYGEKNIHFLRTLYDKNNTSMA